MKTRTLTPAEIDEAMRDYPRPLNRSRAPLFFITGATAMLLAVLITIDPVARVSACHMEVSE